MSGPIIGVVGFHPYFGSCRIPAFFGLSGAVSVPPPKACDEGVKNGVRKQSRRLKNRNVGLMGSLDEHSTRERQREREREID